VGDANRCV
jgi:coatomer subunit beta'